MIRTAPRWHRPYDSDRATAQPPRQPTAHRPPGPELSMTASDDKTARVWQLSDGYCLCTLEGHTNLVRSVAVSPDGEYVATASWDTTARVWHLSNGKCIRTLEGHTGYVNSVVVSPDGMHVVTASSDKTARVWQLSDGTCLHMLKGHTKQVRSAVVSPDGKHRRGDGVERQNCARTACPTELACTC